MERRMNVFKKIFCMVQKAYCHDAEIDVNRILTTPSEDEIMMHKAVPTSALTPRKSARSLSEMSASGVYQFKGSGGEKITIINRDKLRASTAGISMKSKT
jgi:hypothetical protein